MEAYVINLDRRNRAYAAHPVANGWDRVLLRTRLGLDRRLPPPSPKSGPDSAYLSSRTEMGLIRPRGPLTQKWRLCYRKVDFE